MCLCGSQWCPILCSLSALFFLWDSWASRQPGAHACIDFHKVTQSELMSNNNTKAISPPTSADCRWRRSDSEWNDGKQPERHWLDGYFKFIDTQTLWCSMLAKENLSFRNLITTIWHETNSYGLNELKGQCLNLLHNVLTLRHLVYRPYFSTYRFIPIINWKHQQWSVLLWKTCQLLTQMSTNHRL